MEINKTYMEDYVRYTKKDSRIALLITIIILLLLILFIRFLHTKPIYPCSKGAQIIPTAGSSATLLQ